MEGHLTSTKIGIDGEKEFSFTSRYKRLIDVLTDHELASLGDAYVNFIYSLALSRRLGKPAGRKVDSATLASALRKADLRRFLPSRVDRHRQADAAEALIVYAWLSGRVTLEESLCFFEQDTDVDAFCLLLQAALKRISLISE